MPEARQPCHCPKCNGALIGARTRRRHTYLIANLPIPSFSDWSRSQHHPGAIAGQSSNSLLDSDNNNGNHSPRTLDCDNQNPRPSKRLRSLRVRISYHSHHCRCGICVWYNSILSAINLRIKMMSISITMFPMIHSFTTFLTFHITNMTATAPHVKTPKSLMMLIPAT